MWYNHPGQMPRVCPLNMNDQEIIFMSIRKMAALCLTLILLCPVFQAAGAEEALRPVLYDAIITRNYPTSTTTVYAEMDILSKRLTYYRAGDKLQVTAVYPGWVEIRYGNGYGYILRHRIDQVSPVDPVHTPPYGVEVFTYTAVITRDTPVLFEPDERAEVLDVLTSGAKVALLGMENGYAKLVHKRYYGYIDTRLLDEIYPVAGDVSMGDSDTPLAAYCTFYADNPDRTNNLVIACTRLERVMKPGESLNFNNSVGPFSKANGYLPAPVLIDGQTKMGYGGGSCQISSTLYNVVLQLPGLNVQERHPHGASGAAYLPHGVDASSGDLNFRFSNGYDFPIRIEASCHDLCLFIAIYRADKT